MFKGDGVDRAELSLIIHEIENRDSEFAINDVLKKENYHSNNDFTFAQPFLNPSLRAFRKENVESSGLKVKLRGFHLIGN